MGRIPGADGGCRLAAGDSALESKRALEGGNPSLAELNASN